MLITSGGYFFSLGYFDNDIENALNHLRMGRVDETEGGDVGSPVLEVVQVEQVEIQAGDQVVVVGGHHAHSL